MRLDYPHLSLVETGSALEDELGIPLSMDVLLPGLGYLKNSELKGSLIVPRDVPIQPTRRIVVLVPEREFREAELARAIWKLAAPGSLEILFLTLPSNPESQAYLQRRLITLAAITGDRNVQASIQVAPGKSWKEAVRKQCRSGDLLVVIGNRNSLTWVDEQEKMGWTGTLKLPILVLNGLDTGRSLHRRNWFNGFIVWPATLGILATFGWFQVQIERTLEGWAFSLVFFLTVLVEIALLLWLNERTS